MYTTHGGMHSLDYTTTRAYAIRVHARPHNALHSPSSIVKGKYTHNVRYDPKYGCAFGVCSLFLFLNAYLITYDVYAVNALRWCDVTRSSFIGEIFVNTGLAPGLADTACPSAHRAPSVVV